MIPSRSDGLDVGGISTVIAKYREHLPRLGIDIVDEGECDVELIHAGCAEFSSPRGANVAALHGLYWTGDIPALSRSYHVINRRVANSVAKAAVVTVPSPWVAESVQRAFGITPFVVPHGVDVDEWGGGKDGGYVLWAKNTKSLTCDPTPVIEVAKQMPDVRFVSTFAPSVSNIRTPNRAFTPAEMREQLTNCSVYLATTQETFGVATLEAMAAGKPVVGYDIGFQPVIHGVTGWLVPPGDIKGLEYGIRWAMENYEVLGRNARVVAARYTWGNACEKLILALQEAERVKQREHGITIVIPYYKKGAAALKRAVDSALDQTLRQGVKVIVVDDGSGDGVAEKVCKRSTSRLRLISLKKRGGVASARNAGIDAATGEFIVCLDADDALAPHYLEACYRRIAYDRSIGIAYTGLGEFRDGVVRKAEWPGEFDFWQQASGHNCVHTAAMFRKEMWRRAGGFRPRYTRYEALGYGSEDAAFWLHGTALGYRAVRVSDEPLFLYTPGGGTTRAGYTEIPWHTLLGWHRNGYPVSAPSRNDVISWPVYAYDRKFVTIVIPVGAGHEVYLADALDSVLSQTYRKSEIIVVWDSPEPIPSWYRTGYPFVRFTRTGKPGSGAGAARNAGARLATTKFLVFLDADDVLDEKFLFNCVNAWREHRSIVYTDFIGVHSVPDGHDPRSLNGYMGHDALGKVAYNRNRCLEFDAQRAAETPVKGETPYVWALVTTFMPKRWFDAVGGFKEDLEAWEDWDLHLRLARKGYPYFHLHDYLLFYRQNTGLRAVAAQNRWQEWNLYERVG
jgi:glycosyltransferase involved in cell wall biosynthesis